MMRYEEYLASGLRSDSHSLEQARGAWLSLSGRRKERARYKAFTYGRQWDDPCVSSDGRKISEEQRMSEEGRVPVTNNIIRQMIKSVIGRYRYMCEQGGETPAHSLPTGTSFRTDSAAVSDTDARALEEFLISGSTIQRLEGGCVTNVSPDRFFYHRFYKSDGSDCRFMGMLHDMGMAEVFHRFGNGEPRRARTMKEALRRGAEQGTSLGSGLPQSDFCIPGRPDTYRVIELWRLRGYEYLEVHDPANERNFRESVDALERLEGLNRARVAVESKPLEWTHRVEEKWENLWLTPAGEVLESNVCEPGAQPPFAMRFYPLIDGEIHSLVEDVIDQQKYVNRLISLLDHIISSSAKGVLLYPADQLPEGFTWRDIRRIWANPNGILPFKRTAKGLVPQQVTASGTSGTGATEMLKMQLQLFEQISGVTGALSGKSSSAAGEGMLRTELENAMVSMLDILASFRGFVMERDKRLKIKGK